MLLQTTQALLKPQELATLTGAVTAVFVMTQGLRYCFGWKARWVGLFLSFLVSFFAVTISANPTMSEWGMAVPNAFVIFASATGTASITGGRSKRTKGKSQGGLEEIVARDSRRFWGAWY